MNSTTSLGVAAYATAVRAALDDLPDSAKRTVLDGLDDHLAEIVAEGDASLNDTLGPPAQYAAELRATAGFPVVLSPPVPSPVVPSPVAPSPVVPSPAVPSPVAPSPAVPTPAEAPPQWPPPPPASASPSPSQLSTSAPAPPIPRSESLGARAGVWLARSYLGLVGLLLLGVLIANAMNLDSRKVVLTALIVAALWWVGRRALGESRLPETWQRRAEVGTSAAALIAAVMIGGQLSESSVTYYSADTLTPYATDAPFQATAVTFSLVTSTAAYATVPVTVNVVQPGLIVPDVLGMSKPDALEFLDRSGFKYEAVGGLNSASVVALVEPAVGTVIDPTQSVLVVFSDVDQTRTSSTTVIEVAVSTTLAPTLAPTTVP